MIGMKIAALALAVGGLGVVGAGAYHVQGRLSGHRHEMMHKFVEFAVDQKLEAIGATDAQKQKVRAIKERLLARAHALHGERESFRAELLGVLEQESPDPARLKALARERIDAFSGFADEAADALVELHGVFTPQQRQQLLADLREHVESHHR
jgi:Spy/CpxP family protein refolding chaperone